MLGYKKDNIKGDLVSMARAILLACMPIVVLASPKISKVICTQSNKVGPPSHGITYFGHSIACAVLLEALKIYNVRDDTTQLNLVSTT